MRRKPLLLTRDTVGSPARRHSTSPEHGGNRGGVVGPAPPCSGDVLWRSGPRTAYLVVCVALEFPDGAAPPKRLMEEHLTLQQSLRYGLFAPLSKVVMSQVSNQWAMRASCFTGVDKTLFHQTVEPGEIGIAGFLGMIEQQALLAKFLGIVAPAQQYLALIQ